MQNFHYFRTRCPKIISKIIKMSLNLPLSLNPFYFLLRLSDCRLDHLVYSSSRWLKKILMPYLKISPPENQPCRKFSLLTYFAIPKPPHDTSHKIIIDSISVWSIILRFQICDTILLDIHLSTLPSALWLAFFHNLCSVPMVPSFPLS